MGQQRGPYRRTAEVLPLIEKHLRGGKTLKEIAFLLDRRFDAIFKLTTRNPRLRALAEETRVIRYPPPSQPPSTESRAR